MSSLHSSSDSALEAERRLLSRILPVGVPPLCRGFPLQHKQGFPPQTARITCATVSVT